MTAGKALVPKKGIYRVGGSLTINSHVVFQAGAIIKPSSGTVVTLAGGVTSAGLHRIIDHSLGGVVVPKNVDAYLRHGGGW